MATKAKTFELQLESMLPEDWTTYYGIEIPKGTWKATKKYLRQFAERGILFFQTDDGSGIIVKNQLIEIAGVVGIRWAEIDKHKIILWDEDKFPFANCYGCAFEY